MPEKWDLSSIIDQEQQAEIEKLTAREHTQKRVSRFLCRIGWHKRTNWEGVAVMQMASVNEVTGKKHPVEYHLDMRVCIKCGLPTARLGKG